MSQNQTPSGRTGGSNYTGGIMFILTVMLLISVLCLWIGFGPGQRLFVQNVGIGIDPETRPVDPIIGRIFCDIFGILMSSLTVALAVKRVCKFLGR
jgi:hypothetical protein